MSALDLSGNADDSAGDWSTDLISSPHSKHQFQWK